MQFQDFYKEINKDLILKVSQIKVLFTFNLVAIFLFPKVLLSQISFPTFSENPVWKIVTRSFWTGGCTVSTVKTGSPIVICSNTYFPVYECNATGDNCVNIGYYTVNSNSVFVRTSLNCNEQDKIMYSFNLAVNDTLLCGFNRNDITKFWNIQSNSVLYQGVSRLTLDMGFFPYPGIAPPKPIKQMKWIDGIGSSVHPFYSLGCIGSQCEQEQQLLECSINGIITYSNYTNALDNPCAYWVGLEEDQFGNQIDLFPTLAVDFITINNKSNTCVSFEVVDLLGKTVCKGSFSHETSKIRVSDIPRGLYFINLFIDGTRKAVKVNLVYD